MGVRGTALYFLPRLHAMPEPSLAVLSALGSAPPRYDFPDPVNPATVDDRHLRRDHHPKDALRALEARTRYRDWDGRARLVQASGATATAKAAERALKGKLAVRDLFQPTDTTLTPDSLFSDLVTYWLEDIDLEGRISRTTRNLYERNMRTLVSPAFDRLTLREIGVARCDKFIKQLANLSYNRAKQARVVLRLALELAVRHEVLPRTPMDHVSRLYREPHIPDALTAPEVNVIRAAIAQRETAADHISGPKPDGQLGPTTTYNSCSASKNPM